MIQIMRYHPPNKLYVPRGGTAPIAEIFIGSIILLATIGFVKLFLMY